MAFGYTGGAVNSATSGTSVTVTHGLTINAGDLVVFSFNMNNTGTITPTETWNGSDSYAPAAETATLATYWKIAGSSEPSVYTFTLGTSSEWSAGVKVFTSSTDAEVDSAFANAITTTSNTYLDCTAISGATLSDNCLSVIIGGKDNRNPTGGGEVYDTADNSYVSAIGKTVHQDHGMAHRIYGASPAAPSAIRIDTTDLDDGDNDKTYSTHISFVESSSGYTLTADSASYTETGTAANLEYDRKLTADSVSYTETGTAANLKYSRVLSAEAGSYTVSGVAANLEYHRVLSAETSAYVYTGQDATLTYSALTDYTLTADSVAYTETGTAANLEYHRVVNAETIAYTYTGQDATLTYTPVGAYTLTADSVSYTYSGTDANLEYDRLVSAESGSYTETGTVANLLKGYLVSADPGSYSETGQDIGFLYDRVLVAGLGAYTWTGTAADLNYSGLTGPDEAGLEYTLPDGICHFTLPDNKIHFSFKDE